MVGKNISGLITFRRSKGTAPAPDCSSAREPLGPPGPDWHGKGKGLSHLRRSALAWRGLGFEGLLSPAGARLVTRLLPACRQMQAISAGGSSGWWFRARPLSLPYEWEDISAGSGFNASASMCIASRAFPHAILRNGFNPGLGTMLPSQRSLGNQTPSFSPAFLPGKHGRGGGSPSSIVPLMPLCSTAHLQIPSRPWQQWGCRHRRRDARCWGGSWGNLSLLHPGRGDAETPPLPSTHTCQPDLRPLATRPCACASALCPFLRSLLSFPIALAITWASLISFCYLLSPSTAPSTSFLLLSFGQWFWGQRDAF